MSSSSKTLLIFSDISENSRLTHDELDPILITLLLTLSPRTKPIASRIIDLPAPVSPVKTLKPLFKSRLRLSIKTKFLMVMFVIILIYYTLCDTMGH